MHVNVLQINTNHINTLLIYWFKWHYHRKCSTLLAAPLNTTANRINRAVERQTTRSRMNSDILTLAYTVSQKRE